MSARRIVAVLGATGAQGGGVVRALLEDAPREFAVRALTRRPLSDRARTLEHLGADVVFADADDVESLKRAFSGAHGAFCMTDFWAHQSAERELAQAASIAEACRCAGVRHAIWSTLEDTRRVVPLADDRLPTLMGKYKVPHFDAKGEANGAFERLSVPTTFLMTSFYWDNLLNFPGMRLRKGAGGCLSIVMALGDRKMPGIAADDIGRCARGVFREGLVGRTIGIAGEHLTGDEMAAALTKGLGRTVRYENVAPEVYRAFDVPGAAELANMMQFKRDFSDLYRRPRSVEESRRLNPALQDFGGWLDRHKHEFDVSSV